ncbi:MAG: hypothetical protein M2R45_00227 [Verrucomicrobia subdivision 3 bacterium]|nr:hypothetical protein [Limisphaerales bacterium]MCS1412315.1 hypothetical protein [Limisphaerales bacterium]
MKPISRFLNRPKSFWASVRSLSQKIGYSKGGKIKIPTIPQIVKAFNSLGLDSNLLIQTGNPAQLSSDLYDYFKERAYVLENEVESKLLDAEQAKTLFE